MENYVFIEKQYVLRNVYLTIFIYKCKVNKNIFLVMYKFRKVIIYISFVERIIWKMDNSKLKDD